MAPGKGPGNWKGKLGVGDDGSVTGAMANPLNRGFAQVFGLK
ncbi:hypothetical protein C4J90_2387 [Pseudomonas sp. R2-60-08W]|nr:hypothetical protein C4J90_2387 [Pseudomonas sp. R2-60-08W]